MKICIHKKKQDSVISLKQNSLVCNAVMYPKDADGIVISVTPDQTIFKGAVCSSSAMFAQTYLSRYLKFLG